MKKLAYIQSIIIGVILTSCQSTSQKPIEENQVTDEARKPHNAQVEDGKVIIDRVILFRGVTKEVFEKGFGTADSMIYNKVFNPTTIDGHTETFDLYIYDKEGISLFIKPGTDSIMAIQLILEESSKDDPKDQFRGNIYIGSIKIGDVNYIETIKYSPKLNYYSHRGRNNNFSFCFDGQEGSIFTDPITGNLTKVEFNFERNSMYNNKGYSKDDITSMQLKNGVEFESLLKENGYSTISSIAISLCTIDKITSSIIAGKYQDMPVEEKRKCVLKLMDSCIVEKRHLEK